MSKNDCIHFRLHNGDILSISSLTYRYDLPDNLEILHIPVTPSGELDFSGDPIPLDGTVENLVKVIHQVLQDTIPERR